MMTMNDRKFCMFILSNRRADRIYTIKALEKAGYTGDYFIVIDNEDDTAEEYYKLYGDKVVMFDKIKMAEKVDTIDNFKGRNAVVYARNACWGLAEQLGYTHFMELDDDYTYFAFRFNKDGEYKSKQVRDLDFIMEKMLDFYERSGATSMAFAQGGDYIGGKNGQFGKKIFIRRKVMNTMLCSVHRPFQFTGKINEDVNAYVRGGITGGLYFTVNTIAIQQKATQSNAGGLTTIYLDMGTYVKSFYSVIASPSSVKISKMGNKDLRIHHKIKWANTVPCILDESYKK